MPRESAKGRASARKNTRTSARQGAREDARTAGRKQRSPAGRARKAGPRAVAAGALRGPRSVRVDAPAPGAPGASAEAADAPAPVLSTRERHALRAQAHHLQPIVQVGHEGLHPSVLDAVRRALRDHELIKVRLHEPEDKRAMAAELATQTRAALCGLVGHTVILFRPRPRKRPRQ